MLASPDWGFWGIRMGWCIRAVQGAAVLAFSLAAAPAGRAQTLTMGVGAPVTSIDPHYHQLSPNTAVAHMIFGGLTDDGRACPRHPRPRRELEGDRRDHLGVQAAAGRALPQRQRIHRRGRGLHLRPRAERAELAFLLSPSTRGRSRGCRSSTAIRIRLNTAVPYPLMPTDLASVMILDRETHAAATTEGFNAGPMAVGTGPFRMVSHRNGDRIEFERNDGYLGARPHWQRVNYRMITNDARAHRGAAGRRCGDHRPGADQRPGEASGRTSGWRCPRSPASG